jgi:hypothetical protein
VLGLALVLTGCGTLGGLADPPVTLAGSWAGEMHCEETDRYSDATVDLELSELEPGIFGGHFVGVGEYWLEHHHYDLRSEADVELATSEDGAVEQALTATWTSCESWLDDDHHEPNCLWGDEMWWDGMDELYYGDQDACEFLLLRQQG